MRPFLWRIALGKVALFISGHRREYCCCIPLAEKFRYSQMIYKKSIDIPEKPCIIKTK